MDNKREVLLRIDNLKQYFPLKGGGSVKANDGISLDIYKGETFGLVGESGCGKSTLGRTILQLYHQTYGRTMYYGMSLDDLAPRYVLETIRNLPKLREKLHELEKKRDALEAQYAALSEEEQYAKHGELDQARKLAEDALLNITKIVGGFLVAKDLKPVMEVYERAYQQSKQLSDLEMRRESAAVDVDDLEFAARKKPQKADSGKLAAAKEKLQKIDAEIADRRSALSKVHAEIDEMRKPYAQDAEFQKYEAYRDSGIDLARLSYNEMRRLRRDMQLIFQDPYSSLNPRMSVGQIISEGMLAHGMIKRKDERMQELVLQVMEQCGLAPYFLHRFPHQFSGGQRQRIGIARALATRPKFVVCDEAVSALDVSIQAQIINLLKDLQDELRLTYLFISHDLNIVHFISDEIIVMYLGQIVERGTMETVYRNRAHPYTKALFSATPAFTAAEKQKKQRILLEGDVPSPVDPPKGCRFRGRCPYADKRCEEEPQWHAVEDNHFVKCRLFD